MRVLITGGAGFLGSHLGDAHLAEGDDVIALDIATGLKIDHNLGHPRFRFVRGSVLDERVLEEVVARSDVIYHMAAIVGVEHYVRNPYQVLNVNINGTQNVLKLAHRFRKKVIFSSSSEVYGRSLGVPFQEEGERVLGSTKIDRWCYSTSKAVGEHFCFAYQKLGLPVVVLRYFNVYGPRLDGSHAGRVVSVFLSRLMRGEPLTLIGGGTQTRCFTYVEDAIRGTIIASRSPKAVGKVINVGSNCETSIRELAEMMIRLSGSSSKIVCASREEIYGPGFEDIPRRVPDIRLMRDIIGVTPEIPLEEGLKKTIEWYQNSNGKLLAVGTDASRA